MPPMFGREDKAQPLPFVHRHSRPLGKLILRHCPIGLACGTGETGKELLKRITIVKSHG